MQNHVVTLESPVCTCYRCTRAANSLDINVKEKSRHELNVRADVATDFNVGLIVGSSGSGKTTLAKQIWGAITPSPLVLDKPIIDQFPSSMSYDDCVRALTGLGLGSVPCWIRPAATLSTGQRARAECALMLSIVTPDVVVVIDEWTSTVDRVVAKVMSHRLAKRARDIGARVVLLSCHRDVVEWLNPDWVIDCNDASYHERRSLRRDFKRSEQITFTVRECRRESWRGFSKYHYLSRHLPGGFIVTFGLFVGDDQVGFQCFAEYVPTRRGAIRIVHSNRTVIHPDYCGFGLGSRLIDVTSALMVDRGMRVMAAFSNAVVHHEFARRPWWELRNVKRDTKVLLGGNMKRNTGFRLDVTKWCYTFNAGKYHAAMSVNDSMIREGV